MTYAVKLLHRFELTKKLSRILTIKQDEIRPDSFLLLYHNDLGEN